MPSASAATRSDNRVLAALTEKEYARISPNLQRIHGAHGETLHEAGQVTDAMYFPASMLVGLLVASGDGSTLEVGTIGNEGVVGLCLFWGMPTTPHDAIVVLAGDAYRLSSDALNEVLHENDGVLHDVLLRYTHAVVVHISQTAACNRLHPIAGRLARWLLVSHDRAKREDFPITQEFIAQILAVRRASISDAIRTLNEAKAVSCTRGRISVVDRDRLLAASCECYHIVAYSLQKYLESVLPDAPRVAPLTKAAYATAGDAVRGTIRSTDRRYQPRAH